MLLAQRILLLHGNGIGRNHQSQCQKDDDSLDRGCDGNGNAVIHIIPLIYHGRDQHGPDGGYVCCRGTGYAAKQHAHQDVHDCRAAPDPSHNDITESHQLFGNLPVGHYLGHHDEEGHGDEGKADQAHRHFLEQVKVGDSQISCRLIWNQGFYQVHNAVDSHEDAAEHHGKILQPLGPVCCRKAFLQINLENLPSIVGHEHAEYHQ